MSRATSPNGVSLTGIPHIGRATVIGGLVGAALLSVPLALMLIVLGGGPLSVLFAIHVGAFAGAGFGGMLGAVIEAERFQRTQGGSR